MASKGADGKTCVCKVCDDIRRRLKNIFTLLDTYGWLLDTYIVDFFQDDVWNKLPCKWRDALGERRPEEIGNWVLGKNTSENVWPLSLLAFRETIQSLGINRDYDWKETLKCRGREIRNSKNEINEWDDSLIGAKRKRLEEKHKKLFTKSVKKKKRHEIENIAEKTWECVSFSKCQCIVDIGAGMGHLARTLAYNYRLYVVCLEQDESLSRQARILDKKLFFELQKKIPNISKNSPCHVSTKISESDISNGGLIKKLENEFSKNFQLNEETSGFGIIGLHTCGDLASNLLKLYSNENETRFISIVGCCYMKMTCGTRTKDTISFGYPLSEYVEKMENHKFSYAALEVACHAIENYCDKLRTGNYQDLLVHAYRATLEVLLVKKNGQSMRRCHLKNVKLKEDMTFERYSKAATENLNRENRPEMEDLKTEEVKKCLDRWREVVAFGTLRFMLAPLVETAVLFDRFLYLSEKDLSPSLQPIFDPRLSPRNIVLTSYK